VAWRHILLNGHNTFRGWGQLIDLDAIAVVLELGVTEISGVWACSPEFEQSA
jgi:hypothetical protein